jgi:hypothetical protein
MGSNREMLAVARHKRRWVATISIVHLDHHVLFLEKKNKTCGTIWILGFIGQSFKN